MQQPTDPRPAQPTIHLGDSPPPPGLAVPTGRPYAPPLDLQIRPYVTKGYRVVYRDDWTAQLEKGGDANHILHLILSIVTAGIWLFVWPVIAFFKRKRTVTVTA